MFIQKKASNSIKTTPCVWAFKETILAKICSIEWHLFLLYWTYNEGYSCDLDRAQMPKLDSFSVWHSGGQMINKAQHFSLNAGAS